MNLDFAHYSYIDGKRRFLVTWIMNPNHHDRPNQPPYVIQASTENDFESKAMTGHQWKPIAEPVPTDLPPTLENALLILKPHL